MPLTGEFMPVGSASTEFISDLNIFQCENCSLVQNPSDFNHQKYYNNYSYTSGHSQFTKIFMREFAKTVFDVFFSTNGRSPSRILEIGSGDGEQLKAFKELGVEEVLGVEPSTTLVQSARKAGITTLQGFFSSETIRHLPYQSFDIVLSSYTLDHVNRPVDYLISSHRVLSPGGILAFEVNDLQIISKRGEFCLFEHEHTVYLDAEMARTILNRNGFEVHSINPLPKRICRANSLIVIGKKISNSIDIPSDISSDHSELQNNIDNIVKRIDNWIDGLPSGNRLVGYGAGGRGVMTLALLSDAARFETLFDSNHISHHFLTPKTRVPISGPDRISEFNDALCLVFSFGYIEEISENLLAEGYQRNKSIALKDFYDDV